MLERREFLSEVARIAKLSEEESDTPWMDAIEEVTLRHGLDIKMVSEWIGRKQNIKQFLEEEAKRMRIIRIPNSEKTSDGMASPEINGKRT